MKIKNTILCLCHLSLGLFTMTWPLSIALLTKFDKAKKPIELSEGDTVWVRFDGTFYYAHDQMRTFFEGHLIKEI